MFVRWKNRTLAKRHGAVPAERSLYAVVVKNQRVEGRTKQKVVKYLAHISERCLMDPQHQANFWQRADQALSEIEMTPEQRIEIEEKLLAVVARPPQSAPSTIVFDPTGSTTASESPAQRYRTKSLDRAIIPAMIVEP
jgi:hypothetical protein